MAELHEIYDAATALKEAGDLEGCVAKLRELLEQDANYLLAHSALAIYLQKLGKNEDAVAHARKVTELEPEDAYNFTQLSVVCQRCGLITEAEEAMEHARRLRMQQGGGGHGHH